jgi:hypothetical protein
MPKTLKTPILSYENKMLNCAFNNEMRKTIYAGNDID